MVVTDPLQVPPIRSVYFFWVQNSPWWCFILAELDQKHITQYDPKSPMSLARIGDHKPWSLIETRFAIQALIIMTSAVLVAVALWIGLRMNQINEAEKAKKQWFLRPNRNVCVRNCRRRTLSSSICPLATACSLWKACLALESGHQSSYENGLKRCWRLMTE